MKGLGGGLQNIMRQANQMQIKMKKLQEELATREFNGTAGGDAVTVTVSGSQQLLRIQIKPEVFSSGDKDMIEDLVLTATNEALKVAKTTSEEEMSKITGGMGIPGLF
jgi:DNA-binding YbaB/EbfC family protein